MTNRLSRGMAFPTTPVTLSDGRTITVPDDMGDGYRLVLIFRGSW